MAFCTRCGKQIEEGQICDCPGSKVVVATTGHKPFLERAKEWPQSTKKALRIVSILIVVIILFAAIGSAITAPINTVRGYFQAKTNGNWGKAYGYLPLEDHETDFINKNSFIKLHENTNITSFEVSERSTSSFSVSYLSGGNTSRQTENIVLERKGSSLFFFDAYHVSARGLIVSDYQISVPKGADVYMDDIKLVPRTGSSNTGFHNSDTFVIPRVFTGQHELRVEHPVCDVFTEKVQINESGASSHSIQSLKLSVSVKTGLANNTEDFYRQIVAAALEGNSFESLNLAYTNNRNYTDNIIHSYDQLVSMLHRQEGRDGYKSVNVTRFTDNSFQTELHTYGGTYSCEMYIEFDYVTVSYDWQGNTTERSDSSDSTIYFTYVYENGDWVVQNMQLGFGYY